MLDKVTVRPKESASTSRESVFENVGSSIASKVSVTASVDAIEIFKDTLTYKCLEQTALIGEDLVMKEDQAGLLDLDSENGIEVCKSFLGSLERLVEVMEVQTQDRSYRDSFTSSYKNLF